MHILHLQLNQIHAVGDVKSILVLTADHGNADEMYEKAKGNAAPRAKTSHTLNPVPFIIYDRERVYEIKEDNFGLANVAPTIIKFLGLEKPNMWEESIIK